MMKKVKVRVPATSANLGAGFDSLGAALRLYNYIEAEETESGLSIEICGDTGGFLPVDEKNLVYKTMAYLFEQAEYTAKGLSLKLENHIPVTRGLGSSSACIVGGLLAANALCGEPFSRRELMCMAAKLEGHSDNSTAAFAGGFTISIYEKEDLFYYSHPIKDDLKFVLLIPDFTVTTKKARSTLPGSYPLRDVRFNISHAALTVAAILSGEYENLLCAVDDRIHEPYRKNFIEGYQKIHNRLKSYGALGTYISGSGPTMISLVEGDDAEDFMADMREYMQKSHPNWSVLLLDADNGGAKLLDSETEGSHWL